MKVVVIRAAVKQSLALKFRRVMVILGFVVFVILSISPAVANVRKHVAALIVIRL